MTAPTIRIVRRGQRAARGSTRVYIGRPSVLGNPWTHKPGGLARYLVRSREEAIALYAADLDAQPRTSPAWREIQRIAALPGDVELECWCAPLACHGDVIAERIRQLRGATAGPPG